MTTIRTAIGAIGILVISWGTAHAQGGMLWGEVGRQQSSYGSTGFEGIGYGGGIQFTIGGDSSQSSGFALPVGMEIRGDKKFEAVDLLGVADLAFRKGPISFGPGGNFGLIYRPHIIDSRCIGSVPSGSSCYDDGTRDIGQFFGFGFSGFVKGTFGPQGRAFLQGRYIFYHKDWLYFMSAAEFTNAQFGTNLDVPTDFPEFKDGRDLRISAGYVFGGADSLAKLLRVQYSKRQFNFTKELANSNAMFDQDTNQLSLGFGIAF